MKIYVIETRYSVDWNGKMFIEEYGGVVSTDIILNYRVLE